MQSTSDSIVPTPIRDDPVSLARLFAAVAIVWLHTFRSVSMNRLGEMGRFAVPFFTFMAIALMVMSLVRNPRRSFGDYARSRFVRLYLPFLAWAAISIAAADLKRNFLTHKPPAPLSVFTLLTGSSMQLWFLPFILLMGLALFPIARAVARGAAPASLTFLVAISLGLTFLLCPFPNLPQAATAWQADLFYWIGMSWTALPAGFFGLAAGVVRVQRFSRREVVVAGHLCWAVAMAVYVATSLAFLPTLAGVGLGLAALVAAAGLSAARVPRWPFLSYGIYLAHVLFLESIQALLAHGGVRPSVPLEMGVFLVTLACSVLVCFVLNASRVTRWMLG